MGTNKIICNSLELHSSERDGDNMIGFLWLDHCLWREVNVSKDVAGFLCRKECIECEGISILCNSYLCDSCDNDSPASICEMSEAGCAFFDTETDYPNGWNDMLRDIKTAEDLTLTKIRLVYEDHEHLLDGVLDDLFAISSWPTLPAVPENIKAAAHKEVFQGKQEELYAAFGENSDDIQIRFKQSQPRGLDGYFDGIGVELTARNEMAKELLNSYDNVGSFLAQKLEDYFCGLYVPPYWDKLMAEIRQIKSFSTEYDREEPAAT